MGRALESSFEFRNRAKILRGADNGEHESETRLVVPCSGPVSGELIFSEIFGTDAANCRLSSRHRSMADKEAVERVAERIASEDDRVLALAGKSAQVRQ
jgi:hypothetical protein